MLSRSIVHNNQTAVLICTGDSGLRFNSTTGISRCLADCFAMTQEEDLIARRILALIMERHQRQVVQLQELLGVDDGFEQKVQDLWNKANKT
jgi:hypothetical protein